MDTKDILLREDPPKGSAEWADSTGAQRQQADAAKEGADSAPAAAVPSQEGQDMQPKGSAEWADKNPVPEVQTQLKDDAVSAHGGNDGQQKLSFADIYRKYSADRPQSEEEKARQAKREKRSKVFAAIGDGLSALANLYFTTKGANDSYDPRNDMSSRVRSYWDRINKERKDEDIRYNQGLLSALNKDAEDRRTEDRAERTYRESLRKELAAQARHEEDLNYRREKDEADRKYKAGKDKAQRKQWEKENGYREQRLKLSAEKARSDRGDGKDSYIYLSLGKDNGNVRIPKGALNTQTIRQIFNRIPAPQRASYKGRPRYDQFRRPTGEHEPLTDKEMLQAIGDAVGYNEDVRDALRELSGDKKPKEKIDY